MTFNVSPHVLADVDTCATKAWTRHVKGYTSRGDAIKAVAGQAVHAAVAAYLDPKCPDGNAPFFRVRALAALHAVYDPAFARCPAEELPDLGYTPANLDRLMARWIQTHPPSALPWRKVLMVEEAFKTREFRILVPPPGKTPSESAECQPVTVQLIVRPDAIVEDYDGRIRWVDTKTTGWRIADEGWRRALRLGLQAALYTDATVQRYGDRAALGGWVNAMELRKLPGEVDAAPKLKMDGTPAKERQCAEHKVPYAVCGHEHAKAEIIEVLLTPERVTRAVADAANASADFVAMHGETDAIVSTLNMKGGSHGACRFCPAGAWCEAGRYPAALDSMLLYDPWVVEEGVRE